jgi:hypothetical protein
MLLYSLFRGLILRIESEKSTSYHSVESANIRVTFSTAYRKFLRAVFCIFEGFSGSKQTGDIFRTMERIGDKESAIAERVRALLATANNTAAAVAAVPAANPAVPAVAVPRDPRRLDPGADPARVVANLTAAGIQLAVSIKFFVNAID